LIRQLRAHARIESNVLSYLIVLHPDVIVSRHGILEAVITLFGQDSLAVMWRDTGDFSEAELAELGFGKIVSEELIFRHSAFKTPYSEKHPQGLEVDFVAGPQHEAWVEKQ
jgi:hypothetical protein